MAIIFVVLVCWLIREYEIGGLICRVDSLAVLKVMVGNFLLSLIFEVEDGQVLHKSSKWKKLP